MYKFLYGHKFSSLWVNAKKHPMIFHFFPMIVILCNIFLIYAMDSKILLRAPLSIGSVGDLAIWRLGLVSVSWEILGQSLYFSGIIFSFCNMNKIKSYSL